MCMRHNLADNRADGAVGAPYCRLAQSTRRSLRQGHQRLTEAGPESGCCIVKPLPVWSRRIHALGAAVLGTGFAFYRPWLGIERA
jgi:hypothetical protein